MLLTCESPKITTLKTNNHSSKEVNAHAIRCGLSLFVIVGVVVIPWTQQESITPFFLWYGYKKAAWIRSISYFKRMAYLALKTKGGKLLFNHNIWKCNHSVVVCHWSETININMLILILTTNKLFLLANILDVTHNLLAGFLV